MISLREYEELSKKALSLSKSERHSNKDWKRFCKELKNLSKSSVNSKAFFKDSKHRKNLVDKIIEDYIRGYSSQEKPSLYIILGSIASGKTSLKDTIDKEGLIDDYLYINFDDIKKKLPEYEILKEIHPKKAAAFVQGESSTIAGKLYKKAVKRKINIVYEKNLPYPANEKVFLLGEIKNAYKRDYKISIGIVFIANFSSAWERAKKRYEENRRYVSKQVVLTSHRRLVPNLKRLIKDLRIKYEIIFWDNTHQGKPVHVFARMACYKSTDAPLYSFEKSSNIVLKGQLKPKEEGWLRAISIHPKRENSSLERVVLDLFAIDLNLRV